MAKGVDSAANAIASFKDNYLNACGGKVTRGRQTRCACANYQN